ncbi:hypothetical protein J5Y06_22870 [Tianweitania sediminis]|uniref:Uncharacterized protein n=1 Tax=Tianweitania sediminis TaxID=1502156 RepID=A0A8J7RAL9_9HYPH|nr:hypothetical protein [Tianweitania sediminis]
MSGRDQVFGGRSWSIPLVRLVLEQRSKGSSVGKVNNEFAKSGNRMHRVWTPVAGGLLAAVMAVLCVRIGLDQVVIGVGITLGAQGLTALLHHFLLARTHPRLPAPDIVPVSFFADLPILGPGLFRHHALVYLADALVVAMWLIYRHFIFGLQLAAADEKPDALDAAGVAVVRVRSVAVGAAGAIAGVGVAYLRDCRRRIRAIHDQRRGLSGDCPGDAVPGSSCPRPVWGPGLRNLSVDFHSAASHRHPGSNGVRPDAAFCGSGAVVGNAGPPFGAAVGSWRGVCSRGARHLRWTGKASTEVRRKFRLTFHLQEPLGSGQLAKDPEHDGPTRSCSVTDDVA